MSRIILYPKDVQQLTGKSDRAARRLICEIRTACGKHAKTPLTVYDFAQYMMLDAEQVMRHIK